MVCVNRGRMFTAFRWLLAVAFVAGQAPVQAATPENITAGEIALLPEYCPLTQTFTRDDPRAASVRSPARLLHERLGRSYLGLHHYCNGLIDVMRSRVAGVTPYKRRALLTFALNEYQYVIDNSTPDFVLLPEIYLRVGEAHVELLDYRQALDAFAKSRTLKPDYWPPYARWSAVLLRLGKRAEALTHLEEGLRLMPNERGLIDTYTRMGGTTARLAQIASAASTRGTSPHEPAEAAASAPAPK